MFVLIAAMAFIWVFLVAIPCALLGLAVELLLAIWRAVAPPDVDADPPADWWEGFEAEFRAYTSRDWTAARRTELEV